VGCEHAAVNQEDELARRRAVRTQHPSAMEPLPDFPPIEPTQDLTLDTDSLPSVVRALLEALQVVASEVADELERRDDADLADRLRAPLP
jgi:hypothetical protein